MTPIQALQLLEQATGMLQTNREGHQQIIQALTILKGFIENERPLHSPTEPLEANAENQ